MKVYISFIIKKHCYSILFIKLQFKLKVTFTNFQTLLNIFESLIALSVRLKQNQQQLSDNAISIKYSQSENGVKRINTEQQLKKLKNKKISAFSQYKK